MRVEVVAAVRVEVVAAVRVWVVWLGCGGAGWGFLCRMANSGRASCPAPYKSFTGGWGGGGGTLPQFLASGRDRGICYKDFLLSVELSEKMLLLCVRKTATGQKLWQGGRTEGEGGI